MCTRRFPIWKASHPIPRRCYSFKTAKDLLLSNIYLIESSASSDLLSRLGMDGTSSDFFRNIPAMPPPPGVESNFDNPPSLALHLIVVNAVFLPLMVIAVGIRLYVRVFIAKAPGWDDCKLVANGEKLTLTLTKSHVLEPLYV